ncbi:hypothetical protein B0H11DRAFT_2277997 [Mycena galericulata]|nr:hypothetical protein B0H11DRAFT_2277997 [Mycena galericulata]
MSRSLPPEIWRLSWQHAATADLKTIASSCRLFRDICQPFLFQTLSFFGPMPIEVTAHNCEDSIRDMERDLDRFSSISSSSHIPAMVHNWVFHCIPDVNHLLDDSTSPIPYHSGMKRIVDLTLRVNALFSSTIGVYTNLSKLDITGLPFTPKFCQKLASLPRLSTMHVSDCDIACPASNGGIALKEFGYSDTRLEWQDDFVDKYHLVSPSKLETLSLEDPVPGKLYLSVFSASDPLPCLVTLTLCLDYDARDLFYRFLDCCPELRDLDVDVPPTFAGVPLPETTIPMLGAFRGRVEMAGVFAAGRPVRKIKIDFAKEKENPEDDEPVDKAVIEEALLQISQSTATVEDLTLPLISLDSSVLRLVSQLFPKLKRLVFFLRNTEDYDQESEDEWQTEDGSVNGEEDEIVDVPQDHGLDGHYLGNHAMGHDIAQQLLQSVLQNQADDDHPVNPHLVGQALQGMLTENMLAIAAHDMDDIRMDEIREVMRTGNDVRTVEDPGGEDNKSEYSDTSDDINWHQDEATASRTYEDIELASYEDFLSSLAKDLMPLPRNLRRLGVGQIPRAPNEKSMSDANISAVVEQLGVLYPGLCMVVAGKMPRAWTKKGGVWKPPKPESEDVRDRLKALMGGPGGPLLPFPIQ